MKPFISRRGREAKREGKKTSSQIARKLGLRKAAEVECLVEEVRPWQEWHHAGYQYGSYEPKKTYMFSKSDIEAIKKEIKRKPELLEKARECAIEKKKRKEQRKLVKKDIVVKYDEIIKGTPKARLYLINGKGIWLGNFMVKKHCPDKKEITISMKWAKDKELAGTLGGLGGGKNTIFAGPKNRWTGDYPIVVVANSDGNICTFTDDFGETFAIGTMDIGSDDEILNRLTTIIRYIYYGIVPGSDKFHNPMFKVPPKKAGKRWQCAFFEDREDMVSRYPGSKYLTVFVDPNIDLKSKIRLK